MKRGLLFVVSAPSGCGKGTILKEILKDPRFYYSVSATTRSPREGEIDGVQYRFMDRGTFERLIEQGAMLEYAEYCGNYYGTIQAPIEENLAAGRHVVLEIEVQGAQQIRKLCPDAVFIFILPPGLDVLHKRLMDRGTETAEVIGKRVGRAREEMRYAPQYDYNIVNDVLADAVEDFRMVVRAEECRNQNMKEFLDEVLKNA